MIVSKYITIDGKSYVTAEDYDNILLKLGKVYEKIDKLESERVNQLTEDPSLIDYDKEKLIAQLQDQHQRDCIRINDLITTIHVLAGLYSSLRKTVGMD